MIRLDYAFVKALLHDKIFWQCKLGICEKFIKDIWFTLSKNIWHMKLVKKILKGALHASSRVGLRTKQL